MLDDLAVEAPGATIIYKGATNTLTEKLIVQEVVALNLDFALPENLTVRVSNCGEPNAFYDPITVEIVVCEEFAGWLRKLSVD